MMAKLGRIIPIIALLIMFWAFLNVVFNKIFLYSMIWMAVGGTCLIYLLATTGPGRAIVRKFEQERQQERQEKEARKHAELIAAHEQLKHDREMQRIEEEAEADERGRRKARRSSY